MPEEEYIIAVYCCVVDLLQDCPEFSKLRRRGFSPKLSDAEVITMEIVGEFLEMDKDKAIWKYFRCHWIDLFPQLGSRSSFVRQAANLWQVKQRLQEKLSQNMGAWADPIHLVDGFPLPICHFKRARGCQLFREEAAYGYCASKEETYYGLRGNLVLSFNGTITGITLTAANVDERDSLWEIIQNIQGLLIGDKGYIRAELKEALQQKGINLQTAVRKNMTENRDPEVLRVLKKTRRLVETVIGQLSERFHIERTQARDLWHLTSRIARKVLSHTVAIFINLQIGREPLQFDELVLD